MGSPGIRFGPRNDAERLLADVERRLAEIRARLLSGRGTDDDLVSSRALAQSLDDLRQELDAADAGAAEADADRAAVLLAVADIARRDSLATWLDEAGLRVVATGAAGTARTLVRSGAEEFALLVADVELDAGSGLGIATELRASRPDVPVVLMCSVPPDQIVSRIPWDDLQGETVVLERAISQDRLMAVVRELVRAAAR